jgi:hypothetical protein
MQQSAFSPTPRQSNLAALYTAGSSFGSPSWMPRLEAVEIAGFGIRQRYPAHRSLTDDKVTGRRLLVSVL